MFAGLMSRCRMPDACAAASAAARPGPDATQGSRVVDGNHVRMSGQLPGRVDLAEEAPLVTLGVQDPAVHLDGRLPADGDLPGPVDGRETARAQDPGNGMPGNVWRRDHSQSA